MPVSKMFASLSRTLVRDRATGTGAVIILDGVRHDRRVIFTRRQRPEDIENQTWAMADTAVAIEVDALPRPVKAGDLIEFDGGETWKIKDGIADDYGGGMLEYAVTKHRG